MMILLFKLIIITSILVLSWTIVTQDGMALYKIRLWGNKKQQQGKKWVEPLILCHWCMPSVWSSIGWLFAYFLGILGDPQWNWVLLYPLTVGGSSLTNGIVWGLHRVIESSIEKNEEATSYYTNASKHHYIQIKILKDAYKQKQNFEQKNH